MFNCMYVQLVSNTIYQYVGIHVSYFRSTCEKMCKKHSAFFCVIERCRQRFDIAYLKELCFFQQNKNVGVLYIKI